MKKKKVYLIIAYMFIVLALTLVIVNTQALAIESNAEGNNVLNTNVNTEKITFKAKVKYKKFPLFDENNPVIRKEVLVGLSKNGVDLGKKYEKFVSTRFDEVELNWDNLEKYTVQNGVQKENVYEIKLKSDDINERFYEVEVKSNEIIITSRQDLTDYTAIIKFKDFDKNEIKPNFKVELYSIKYRPVEEMKKMGEKYDREVNTGKEEELRLNWEDLPNVDHYGVRIKNLDALDKEKYKVVNLESEIVVIKNKEEKEAADESVEIKDLNLKKILIDIINKNNKEKLNYDYLTYKEKTIDSKIYKKELEEIKNLGTINTDSYYWRTSIDLREVKSLEGIENLINLEEMNVNVRDEKQLLELSKLKTIKKLQLETKGDNLDTESLKGFTNLEKLQLFLEEGFGNLKDLNFLNDMKKLVSLKISNADIKNLDAIKDSSIKELYLNVKNIPSVTPITENQNIENLTIKLPGIENPLHGGTDKEIHNAKLDAYMQLMAYYRLRKELTRDEIIKIIKEDFELYPEEAEKYINELKEIDNSSKIKNLKELLKLKNLKSLTLNGVKLENIDGISSLKNLKELDISNNLVSNLSEILKLENLKKLSIKSLPIYDKRIIGELKGKIENINDKKTDGEIGYKFLINPEKFNLPDIYNENGEKFDLLDKNNFITAPMADGATYFGKLVDLYNDINNIIKKNEDGTYSYKYKPYEPITISKNNITISLYPINNDHNEQDLNKIDKRYKVDKTKIVKFKNPKLKEYILGELKAGIKFESSNELVGIHYIKEKDEMEVYEDELKFIEKVDLSQYNFSGVIFKDGEDISDLAMFPNISELTIHRETESLEFLKDLPNLRKLTMYSMKKGQHLPKFKENNKLKYLNIDLYNEYYKFDKDQIENIKRDVLDNNLLNLKYLTVSYFSKISLIRLEDLKNLNSYTDPIIIGRMDSKNYMVDTYESEELNINYNNKKIITEKELVPFDKNTDENVVIRTVFKPTTKKFRINILDKVNNKNIEINDPALIKNEDGTYEMVSYAKKLQEVTFEIDGKKVILKIDTTGMPLTNEEESERKDEKKEKVSYEKQDLKKIVEESNYILEPDEDMTPEEIEEYKKNSKLEFEKVKNVSFGVDNENDLELLGKFKNIEILNLYVNNVDNSKLDWSIIKNLKNLKKLIIHDGFDIANIEGMESLEELITSETKDYYDNDGESRFSEPSINIKNIEKISTLKNLKILNLPSANIKNIDLLKELTNLEELYLGGNKIKNLDALKNLNKLRIVKLTANEIVNIDGLKNKENLRVLELQENKITDISALEKSAKLYRLDIIKNDVENVDVLRNFKKLNYIGLTDNPRLKGLSGLKEALKENISPNIFMNVTGTSVEDEDLVETINANDRIAIAFARGNEINIKPKRNRFDINLTQNGNKIELSDAPFFRNSGLIKNEDGTYSFKDYKNSGVIRLNVGVLPRWIEKNEYRVYEGELRPYHYLYIDPSDIREEDKVVPTPEKEEENPREENKVEEKVEDKISEIHEKPELTISKRKLPYAGMQDDTMLKVLLVLVSIYTTASFNLYKKGLEKKNNNK